jgi:hypothetical protein
MVIAQAGAAKKRHGFCPAHSLCRGDPEFDQVSQRRLRCEVGSDFDAGHQGLDVGLLRQEVGLDLQRAVRPRRLHPQPAPAPDAYERRREDEGVLLDGVLGGDLGRDMGDLPGQEHLAIAPFPSWITCP